MSEAGLGGWLLDALAARRALDLAMEREVHPTSENASAFTAQEYLRQSLGYIQAALTKLSPGEPTSMESKLSALELRVAALEALFSSTP